MRESRTINVSARAAFALVVVAASILAPFRTSLARAPLERVHQHSAPRSMVRVRTLCRAGTSAEAQAVTAIARGGDDEPIAVAPVVTGLLTTAADSPSSGQADRRVALPSPHLRC